MKYRPLGKTGLSVSEIGLGATQIGWPSVTEAEAERVLQGALDAGINFIDTAARYRLSESRIGRFLAKQKSRFIVATKCGGWIEYVDGQEKASWDYSAAGILRTIDRSRQQMKLDVIDIVQFHGLPNNRPLDPKDPRSGYDVKAAFDALFEAKARGWVRFVGVSSDGAASADVVRQWPLDVQECNYNLLLQEAETDLFPLCQESQRGVIAKRPIANRVYLLKERPEGNEEGLQYDRAQTFPLRDLAGGGDLIDFTLRFTLAHPAVSTAIIGTASAEHLAANARVSDGRLLPADTLARAKQSFRQLFGRA